MDVGLDDHVHACGANVEMQGGICTHRYLTAGREVMGPSGV